MIEIVDEIIAYSISNQLEMIAVIFGLLSVWYAKKENILVFPTGIISVLIYVYILIDYRLYADMMINAYYFVMSVYGWIVWSKTDENKAHIPITHLTKKEKTISIVMLITFFLILSYSLRYFTDSDVPYWDATTTSLFFVAMWMMAKKKIENWILWIAADIISIPLYFYKTLFFSSFQFLIFTIMAILGYIEWKKTISTIENKDQTLQRINN